MLTFEPITVLITGTYSPVNRKDQQETIWRAKVPGGWLLFMTHNEKTLTFYPDAMHAWDGDSLP